MPDPAELSDWLAYIDRIHPRTIEMGLARIGQVRRNMGIDPVFPVITVAGTNGKGSVCAMLEAILHHAGYKVGCYTSPHLLRFNERIRIGKTEVSDASICAAFSCIEAARREISLTYFEFSTLAAVKILVEAKVDIAILEVGLGGRLDAVNAFDADCSVVTGIDFDHMDYLGDTREKIGFEKAGIFRRGKFAICGDPDVPQSILQHAGSIGTELLCFGRDFGFSAGQGSWNYRGPGRVRNGLPYPALQGRIQTRNASTALAAIDCLELAADDAAISGGLLDLALPGRFQVFPGNLVLDVAHNPQAAGILAMNLADMSCSGKTIALFGMLADKDIEGVIRQLKGSVDEWLVFGLDVARGASLERLALAFSTEGVNAVQPFSSLERAWHHACASACENDRIIVFGSFYTVADFMGLSQFRMRD